MRDYYINRSLFCLLDGPEVGLLNKSSRLAAASGVTKFKPGIALNLVTLCCAT